MRVNFKVLQVVLGSFTLFACSPGANPKPPNPPPEAKKPVDGPLLVGRIASIPADKRFVLIQSYGKWSVETGKILTTRGTDERTANLLTTGESLGVFAAADLQSGCVEVGDAVYTQHLAQPIEPPTPADAAKKPDEGGAEIILKNN